MVNKISSSQPTPELQPQKPEKKPGLLKRLATALLSKIPTSSNKEVKAQQKAKTANEAKVESTVFKVLGKTAEEAPPPLNKKGIRDLGTNLTEFNTEEIRASIEKPREHKQDLARAQAKSNLPVEHVSEIPKVTDSGKVLMKQTSLCCGVTDDPDRKFTLDVAVGMRKGPAETTTPKAMGEDAHVTAEVSINVNGVGHQVPLIAVLDGGGGHQLAQYAQEHLADTFQEELQTLVDERGTLDSGTVEKALDKTNDRIFGRDIELTGAKGNPYYGEGYAHMREGHAEVARFMDSVNMEYNASNPEMTFKTMFSKRGKNPEKCHALLNQGGKALEEHLKKRKMSLEEFAVVKLGDAEYDLKKPEDAAKLQGLYEKATGSEGKIECQVSMTAYHASEEGDLIATSFNRGDSQTVHSGKGGLTALGPVTNPLDSHVISAVIEEGSRITASCDGHREKISLTEQEEFDGDRMDMDPGNYTYEAMQASIQTGSHDDITIISAQVKRDWVTTETFPEIEGEKIAAKRKGGISFEESKNVSERNKARMMRVAGREEPSKPLSRRTSYDLDGMSELPKEKISTNDLKAAFSGLIREEFGRAFVSSDSIKKLAAALENAIENPEVKCASDAYDHILEEVGRESGVEEMVDSELFKLHIYATEVPIEIYNAPEYQDLKEALEDGSWSEGEERTITPSWFKDTVAMESFMTNVRNAFENEDFKEVLDRKLS